MKKIISFILSVITVAMCVFSAPCASALTAPKIDAKANGSKYSVWWNYKASGVTQFYVYVDGKYDGYKKVTSSGKYTYTTDPYTTGKPHSIQIKALKGKKTYASSAKINRVLLPSKVSIKTLGNENGYTLSTTCSGTFHGVSLYKYNSSIKKYSFYKNFTKKLSITSSVKTTYMARAYVKYGNKVYYGAYTSCFSCAPQLGAVTLSSVASSSVGKISMRWVKPKYSFSGYQITYTSFDNFSYNHIIKVASSATKTTLSLKEGVCYKLAIRTYRTKNGTNIYGKWSTIKTLYTRSSVGKTVDAKDLLNKKMKLKVDKNGIGGKTNCVRLNNAMDKILNKLKCGPKSTYSNYDKIKLIYQYIATEQFKKDGTLGASGSTSYKEYPEMAVYNMLKNKCGGSCYEYNYLFMYLCKRIGVQSAYMVHGSVSASGGGRTEHWWCMIKIDGDNYYFDPRMQKYTSNNKALTFLCLPMNGGNTYSNYYRFIDAEDLL